MTTVQSSSTRATFLPGQLNVGAAEDPGVPFVTFDNGVRIQLQADGNIVVYDAKAAVWASKSNVGRGDPTKLALKFQADGNLVEFHEGQKTWDTKTAGKGKKLTVLDAPPYLTILDADGNIAWYSEQDKK